MTTPLDAKQAHQEKFLAVQKDDHVLRLGQHAPNICLVQNSIYLAGSDPGQIFNSSTSWRIEAVHTLRSHGYTDFISYPETPEGNTSLSGRQLAYWQAEELGRATRVIMWFDTHSQCTDKEALVMFGRLFEMWRHDTKLQFELYVGWEGIRSDLEFITTMLKSRGLHRFESLGTICRAAAVGT